MLIATLIATTLLAAAPKPAEIFPRNAYDFRVYVTNTDGDLGIGNDSHLLASAQIRTMGASGEVVQPHIPNEVQILTHPDVIGGQGGFFQIYRENTKEYNVTHGRNCWVEIITPGGYGNSPNLSDHERGVSWRLFERTMVDNVAVPLFLFVTGLSKNKLNPTLHKALVETFTHNTKFIENLRDLIASGGSPRQVGTVILEFLIREIETGGLAKEFIIDGLSESLPKLLARQMAIWGLTNVHPSVRVAYIIVLFLDKGTDAIQVLKTTFDLFTTPTKITFKVLFDSELYEVWPTRIVPTPVDQNFVLSGYQMFQSSKEPMSIAFYDKNNKAIHYASPDWILPNGTQAGVTLPKEAVRAAASPLTVIATFGGKAYTAPQKIYIGPQLEAPKIFPQPASIHQPVEVHSSEISRYLRGNKVFFGDNKYGNATQAEIERVAEGYIVVKVPYLDATPPEGGHKVWIERDDGRAKFKSKQASFTLDPEPYEEKVKKLRDRLMPVETEIVEGVLSPQTPIAEIPAIVEAGMQVKMTLIEVTSQENVEPVIKSFGLNLLVEDRVKDTATSVSVATAKTDIRGRQPNAWLTHTTDGRQHGNIYRGRLEYGSGGNLKFKVQIERIRRDDCESGVDASALLVRPLPIQTGRNYKGYLFGHELKANEDRLDQYLIPDVQAGQKIKLKILDLKGHAPAKESDCTLGGLFISRVDEPGAITALASKVEPIHYQNAQKELFYEDSRAGDYIVSIRHGSGNVEYTFRVEVGFDVGPDPALQPIKSLFDAGNSESWQVEFPGRPVEGARWLGKSGDGFISPNEMFGNRAGPLDLAFVIDCTASMTSIIDSVKAKSAEIVDRLRVYSPDMRLGITFFADAEATGSAASAIRTTPIAPDPLKQLQTMSSWGILNGGSDEPEDMLLGLKTALDQPWRQGSVGRAIVVITDNPAKLSAGKDGQGNTMDSIISLARSKGIQIIPVPTNNKAALLNDCNLLASRTGGQVVSFTKADQIVDLLSDIVGQSIERALPAYWVAPAKFLGDVSRFYGSTLSFKISCEEFTDGFSGDDILLSNGDLTLALKSALRPSGATMDRRNWINVSVPLSDTGTWRVRGTNQVATKDQILDVMTNLKSLKIRAEYYGGRDSSYMDTVALGSNNQVTDRGLSDAGEADARYILDSIDAITRRWKTSYEAFERGATATDWLYSNLQGTGITPESFTLFMGSDLSNPLGTSTTRGPRHALLEEMVAKLYRWLDQVRYRGMLTAEQRTIVMNAIRDWNARMRTLDTDFNELKQGCLSFIKADYAYQKARAAGASNTQALEAEKSRWDTRVYELKNKVSGHFAAVYLPVP